MPSRKCCANCSHLNDEQECRCPGSAKFEKYILDIRGVSCKQYEMSLTH